MMLDLRPAVLFCLLAASLPGWRMVGVSAQQGQLEVMLADITEEPQAPDKVPTDAPAPDDKVPTDAPASGDDKVPTDAPVTTENKTYAADCRELQYPCTRIYSVHRPVKQCLSLVCVSSMRRVYMVNKEVCSRIVCKEDEVMQEERCRQKLGLPPRRSARSNRPCK